MIYSLAVLLFIKSTAHASENPVYTHVDKQSQARSAIAVGNGVLVLGPKKYLRFDGEFSSAHFVGPLEFDGTALLIERTSGEQMIIAGLNHKGSDLLGKDTRQGLIALMHPSTGAPDVRAFRKLGDSLPIALEVDDQDQPVVLLGHDGQYTLAVFDSALKKILRSIKFGSGQKADLAITGQGNFGIVGFDAIEGTNELAPTYWEFTPDLELHNKETLGEETKKRSQADAVMELLAYRDELYIAYGWDQSGVKDEKPDEVKFRKLRGSRLWQEQQRLPYHHRMRFFVSPNGSPYVLYPRIDTIQRISFASSNGLAKKEVLNRPTSPVECFPPRFTYSIVDVFGSGGEGETIVISSNPLDHPEAGCVTIGVMK